MSDFTTIPRTAALERLPHCLDIYNMCAEMGGASCKEIDTKEEVIQFKREIEFYYACNYIDGETDKFTVNNDVWNTMGLEIKRNVKEKYVSSKQVTVEDCQEGVKNLISAGWEAGSALLGIPGAAVSAIVAGIVGIGTSILGYSIASIVNLFEDKKLVKTMNYELVRKETAEAAPTSAE